MPRNHLSDAHKWTMIHVLQKQLSICTRTVVTTIFSAWAVRAELQYSGKIEIQKRPALFRNPQSFVDCSMERSIRYNFFDWLESIQHKLSFDYGLSIYFSRRFFHIDGPWFFRTNPYKMSIFQRSVTCRFFQEWYSHVDKNSGQKVWGYVLVKIASKGTFLKSIIH